MSVKWNSSPQFGSELQLLMAASLRYELSAPFGLWQCSNSAAARQPFTQTSFLSSINTPTGSRIDVQSCRTARNGKKKNAASS